MKILYVATVQSHIGQFHMPFIRELKNKGHIVHVACQDNSKQKPGLDLSGIDEIFDVPFSRSPYRITNIKAYKQLKKIISNGNYDIIHCHTPVGGILCRFASKKARKKGTQVFYTAHGFHFFKGAPKKNWILYYPVEKYCAKFTDVLFTMNSEDYAFANEHFSSKHIEYIPGVGIDIEKFSNCKCNVLKIRNELNIPVDSLLIMSVGELNNNKNYKVVLDAISKLNTKSIYYAIVGVGPLKEDLQNYAKKINMVDNFKLLGYRRNLPELFKACDLVVQPSLREGLPLTVMEAMASCRPIIASDIRGCRDLLLEEDLFNPLNIKCIATLIQEKINNLNKNVDRNFSHIQKFCCSNVIQKLLTWYEE